MTMEIKLLQTQPLKREREAQSKAAAMHLLARGS